jgi:hypothetical protein
VVRTGFVRSTLSRIVPLFPVVCLGRYYINVFQYGTFVVRCNIFCALGKTSADRHHSNAKVRLQCSEVIRLGYVWSLLRWPRRRPIGLVSLSLSLNFSLQHLDYSLWLTDVMTQEVPYPPCVTLTVTFDNNYHHRLIFW